ADMKQSRISTMERPGATQFNVETLIRLASAFKLGLKVEFVSFSGLLRWENEFNSDSFNPLTIENDIDFKRDEAPGPAEEPRQAIAGGKLTAINSVNGQQKRSTPSLYDYGSENAAATPGVAIDVSQPRQQISAQGILG